jgi:hypothetical protein
MQNKEVICRRNEKCKAVVTKILIFKHVVHAIILWIYL